MMGNSRFLETEKKINEAYDHYKSFFNDLDTCGDLHYMCREQNCSCYKGLQHDFTACKDKSCFHFYLAYKYMTWCEAWSYE